MADSSLPPAPLLHGSRTEGIHASTLLRLMHARKKNDITDEQLSVYGLLGLAFEDRAERALAYLSKQADWPWNSFRPGEVQERGILCSPDIMMVPKQCWADQGWQMKELSLKCKWMSTKGIPLEEGEDAFDRKKWGYVLDQCMTYGTPLDTWGAFLLVYFVQGDYKGSPPQAHGWELEWSEQERAETWQELEAQIEV